MKKLLLSGLCAMLSAAANAQNVMVVEQKSGTATEFNVDDIQRVYFKNNGGADVNPSNSVLSSRLKDKDGNPIFLTFVGSQHDYDENNGYGTYYFYDEKGALTSFGRLPSQENRGEDAFFVDGLSYYSYSMLPDYSELRGDPVEGTMNLNDDGFISELSCSFKELLQEGIDEHFKYDLVFTYNSKNQLVKIEGDVYTSEKNYDETLKTSSQGKVLQTFIWEEDNIVRKETTYFVDGETISDKSVYVVYGNERNVSKQFTKGLIDKVIDDDLFGFGLLYSLGLFGVGPVNLPTSIDSKVYTYTLNENGTIASEKRSNSGMPDVYIYK